MLKSKKVILQFGLLLMASACGGPETSETSGTIDNSRKMPGRQNIRVCFTNGSGLPDATAMLAGAVRREFSRTVLSFVGFDQCNAADAANRSIRIEFQDSKDVCGGPYLGCSSIGPTSERIAGASTHASMIIRIPNFTWGNWTAANRNQVADTTLHEIGHAIGMLHEHQRMDASNCGSTPDDPNQLISEISSPRVFYVGTYDQSSIMNYCRPRNQTLTETDIQSINLLYHGQDCNRFGEVWAAISNGTRQSAGWSQEVKWASDHCSAHQKANYDRMGLAVDEALAEVKGKSCSQIGDWYVTFTKAFGVYNALDGKWALDQCNTNNFARIEFDIKNKVWHYWN